jgi:hypothetical protein
VQSTSVRAAGASPHTTLEYILWCREVAACSLVKDGIRNVMGELLQARIAPLLDDDPTPAEFTEAIYRLRNETLGGLLPGITFPRQADRSEVNLCVIPVTFKDKKFVTPASEAFICAPDWKPAT